MNKREIKYAVDFFSDLHLDQWEFRGFRPYNEDSKFFENNLQSRASYFKDHGEIPTSVAIVAGDTGNGVQWSQRARDLLEKYYDHVIIEYGNHDFECGSIGIEEHPFVSERNIGNLRILTSCLWTDFWGKPSSWKHMINGFSYMKETKEIIENAKHEENVSSKCAERISSWYRESRRQLLQKSLHRRVSIVASHFSPTLKGQHPKYIGNPLNPYFCSDDDDLVKNVYADVWQFGHTHSPFNFYIGNTEVICNPLGNPGENNIRPLAKVVTRYFCEDGRVIR